MSGEKTASRHSNAVGSQVFGIHPSGRPGRIHLNVCLFCMDIARAFTIQASMNQAKFDALEQYRTSPLFPRPSAPRWITRRS